MLISAIPYKFTLRWGQNAPGADITNPIPMTTGTLGRASFDQGYPPITFTALNAGGIPPDGRDDNGILYALSAWAQWQQAGGPVAWDSAFATGITGYPLGATVASATVVGWGWLNGVDGNTTNPDAGGAGWTPFQFGNIIPATGAQLQFTSSTLLTLAAREGGFLWINGFNYPVGAPTLTNSGFTASALWYIYARVVGGFVVLDKSTTGYTLNANGVPQKAGDATQTCVGMVFTNSSSQFVSQDGALQVRSYFQRSLQRSRTSFGSDQTTSNSTLQELSNTIRNSVLVWAGENVQFAVTGNTQYGSGNAVTAVSFDGGAAEPEATAASGVAGIGISGVKTGLTEGLHYSTIFGAVSSSGTGIWRSALSGPSGTAPTTITVGLQG